MDLPWRIEMLGGMRARRGPVLITRWATGRAAALLARLCLFPQRSHPREELIDLLWPDAELDAGRNRLRVAVASLRRQLEPPGVPAGGVLIADRSMVRLNPVACRSDVAEFEAALAAAARSPAPQAKRDALDRALALFGGELLPGFYDDWIVDERERLNALYEDALDRHAALPPSPPVIPAVAPDPEPPKQARGAELRGFPLQFTRFFGREREQDAAVAALTDGATRLVTLTGPGGSGKTRLAAEAARQAATEFPGPVCWVSLADLTQPSLIPDAVAQSLGLTRDPDLETLAQVAATLAAQPPGLLVLDNFEHLVEGGVPLLFALLSRVPSLTCLVTSRRRLGLPGEREQPVASLLLPDAQSTPAQIAQNDSVQLFVDRAQAARPDFQLSPANAAPVARLCCTLEGLPLAIELIAARAQALTPAQMNERLSQRFALPESDRARRKNANHTSGRQGSLWAAMAYSYDLIPPALQRFFAGLSVFRGGCTVEAAAAVCAESGALESLTQLRERSLLVLEDGPEGVRFRMLETLREYALDRLRAGGEERAVRTRHRDYFLTLAETAEPKLMGEQAATWLIRLNIEQNNLRTALEQCLAEETEAGAQTGLRLVVALSRFWQARGELTEGRARLAAALDHPPAQAPTVARAWALRWAGLLALFQGDYATARSSGAAALALFRALGEMQGSGWALTVLGYAAANLGEIHESRTSFEEALALFREAEDAYGIGCTLNNLGNLLMERGELADAKPLYEESLARLRAAGNRPTSVIMLTNLGALAYYQGDWVGARLRLEESLALRTEMGNRSDQAGYALVFLAAVALCEGNRAEAWAHLKEGLTSCRDCRDKMSGANLLEFTGRLQFAAGQPDRAAWALGAAARLRREMGVARQQIDQAQYEADLAGVQASLTPAEFADGWAAGEALAWEEAVDEILREADEKITDVAKI